MTPQAVLAELLDRVAAQQGNAVLLNADELAQWPAETVATLKAQKVITRARPAVSAVCPGCERECVMPVHTLADAGRTGAFIVCDKRSDISRVPVPDAQLEQWQASGDSIADLLAGLLSLQRPNMGNSLAGRWEVGVFRGKKHASHLVLLAGERLTLTMAGHSIALTEVLALEGNRFKVDKRRLTRLVDQPVAGAGDIESAEQRRERIKKRVNELKAHGVRAFLKTVADEEGLSISRIKQLIQDDDPAPKSKASYW
ncbi:hypothetical protein BJI67_15985 (plasmid) [Acidihalobacter aeolianus]|uniref:Uncharacterized protein n=1 Tax=Acidihalobacter aeolianus TaxID=2792603 RepID=A0A1D8KCR2_9GAMM|nr:hypothetical protein [Acidihalobacter aeolianus]AOV18741.1 hypothetical protein BJI67_15985 [Acidihalobacter aeolianus]